MFFKLVFDKFKSYEYFNLKDVLKFLNKNPKIIKINSAKKTKFVILKNKDGLTSSNEVDTSLNI